MQVLNFSAYRPAVRFGNTPQEPVSRLYVPSSEEGRLTQQGLSRNQIFAAKVFVQVRDFLDSAGFQEKLNTLPADEAADMLQKGLDSLRKAVDLVKEFGLSPATLDKGS